MEKVLEGLLGIWRMHHLDRQDWSTRLELATALFDYLEIFHNRQRRHSSLGVLTPIGFETRQESAAPGTEA